MSNQEELTEKLNDLIKINNDRIAGYEKAAEQTKSSDADLTEIFQKMANESRSYKLELEDKLTENHQQTENDTTVAGKLYRSWMTVKNMFTGSDRKSILESCEFGEDAAQKAYDDALASDAEMDADTRKLIVKQKKSLKNSHDIIKKYRDVLPD